ncbi:hypothetical protein BJ944DRAFT_239778 [Cunninghamella echinulata]|nr:hypothetical protein BJ944DRAFT_239778 [Cunninghamella echinulata]
MSNKDLDTIVYKYLVESGQKQAAEALKKNSTIADSTKAASLKTIFADFQEK